MSRHSIAPWLAVAFAKTGCARCNLQNGADGSATRLRQGYVVPGIEGKVAREAGREFGNGASFKSDKILSIALWIFAGAAAAPHVGHFVQ